MASARRSRRVLRWFAIALGVVAVLAGVLAAVSQTAAFRSWLRGELVARLNATLDGRLEVASLEGSLFGGAALGGVRLVRDDGRVVAVGRVAARYDAWPLVYGGALRIRRLVVDGLAVTLVEGDGTWNVAGLVPPAEEQEEEGGGLDVVIERLVVRNASVKVLGAATSWHVRYLKIAGAARVTAAEQRVEIDALSAVLARHDLRIEALEGHLAVDDEGGLDSSGALRTAASRLAWRASTDEGRYDVAVEIGRLAADELRALAGPSAPAVDLAGRVRAQGPADALTVHGRLASAAGGAALRGVLDVAAEPPAYDVGVAIRDLDLARLLAAEAPASDLDGRLDARGSGLDPGVARAVVTLALAPSTIGDARLDGLTLRAEVAPAAIALTGTLASASGSGRIEGTVAPRAEDYALTVHVESLDPGAFLDRPALAGDVDATLRAEGSGFGGDDATLALTIDVGESRLGEVAIQRAAATIDATPARVEIERLEIATSVGRAEATGTVALAGADPEAASGRLAVSAQVDDARPLGALAGVDAAGSLRLTGTVEGRADDLDVRVGATGQGLAIGDAGAGTVELRARADGLAPRAGAGPLGLPAGSAEVTMQATAARAGGRAFDTVDLEGAWERARGAGAGAGRLELTATEPADRTHRLRLTAAVDAAAARLRLETLRLEPGPEAWTLAGAPTITVAADRVTVDELVLASDQGRFRLAGSVGRRGPADLTLTVERLALESLAEWLPEDVSGALGGSVRLTGTAAAPELEARAMIADPAVGGVSYGPIEARATVAGGRAELQVRVEQDAARGLAVDAALPVAFTLAPLALEPGEGLTGTVRANDVEIAFLDPFVDAVTDLAGRLDGELAIAGPLAAPRLRGALALAGGRARVPAVGLVYDPIEAAVGIDGDALVIERLHVRSGAGTLRGEGALRVGAEPTFDVRAELTRFPLLAREEAHAAASGWVWATGTPAAPVVEGTLETDGLTIRLPEETVAAIRPPDPTITVVRPAGTAAAREAAAREAAAREAEPPALYERAAITVQITVPRDAWLRRSDAEVELRGWLTVWKKPGAEAVRIAGEIDAVRGWYAFRSKRFSVVEGKVTFTGKEEIDPLLDLTARHRTRNYDVFVVVGGTVREPKLRLESEPPLEQGDVLSVLLFGKTTDELSGNESEVLADQTAAIAGSYAAQGLTRSVAGTLGLDTLSVDAGGGYEGTAITAGKYVADDIFVSLANTFGRESVVELRIEWQLLREWSLETSSDTLGRSGIDVFWRRRY